MKKMEDIVERNQAHLHVEYVYRTRAANRGSWFGGSFPLASFSFFHFFFPCFLSIRRGSGELRG